MKTEFVAVWFARIKSLALHCKFGENLNTVILNKFICGMNGRIFEKLCEKDEKLTLDQAFKKALVVESKIPVVNAQAALIKGDVLYVKQKQSYGTNNKTKVKKQSCTHCGWKNQKSICCKFKAAKCH